MTATFCCAGAPARSVALRDGQAVPRIAAALVTGNHAAPDTLIVRDRSVIPLQQSDSALSNRDQDERGRGTGHVVTRNLMLAARKDAPVGDHPT